jgi:glycosyltransferase involved in cell wall biosynthesis
MTTNQPFISVIIPTYNEEKRIKVCLESILAQKYPKEKLEILLVDGLSTDKTVEITKNYPVKIIINKKRVIPEACNLGVKNARGTLLVFMGADSELPQKNWIELMIAPLMENACVAGAIPILTPNKRYPAISRFFSLMQADPIIVLAYGSGLEIKSGYITADNYFPMGISVIRKELVTDSLAFKSSLSRSEDVDITYRLVCSGYKFAVVPNAGLYHLYVGSYSAFLRKTCARIKIFVNSSSNCEFNYIPKNGIKSKFLQNLLHDASGIGVLSRIVKGIRKDRDLAWLCYPFVLFSTIIIYGVAFASSKQGRKMFRTFTGRRSPVLHTVTNSE